MTETVGHCVGIQVVQAWLWERRRDAERTIGLERWMEMHESRQVVTDDDQVHPHLHVDVERFDVHA